MELGKFTVYSLLVHVLGEGGTKPKRCMFSSPRRVKQGEVASISEMFDLVIANKRNDEHIVPTSLNAEYVKNATNFHVVKTWKRDDGKTNVYIYWMEYNYWVEGGEVTGQAEK